MKKRLGGTLVRETRENFFNRRASTIDWTSPRGVPSQSLSAKNHSRAFTELLHSKLGHLAALLFVQSTAAHLQKGPTHL